MVSEHHRRGLVVVALMACLTLVGCGTEQTGHGAPPYQDITDGPGQSNRTDDGLTVHLPKRLSPDKRAVGRRFAAFEHALARSLQAGHPSADLNRLSYPTMHAQLAKQIRALTKADVPLPGDTTLLVKAIDTSGTVATVQACQVNSSGRSPVAVLMVRSTTQPWRVTTLGRVGKHGC